MKQLFLLALCSLSLVAANSQHLSQQKLDSMLGELQVYRDSLNDQYARNGKSLVHNYTFRRLVQKDFAKIISGENSFSKAGRYATLDLNTDESQFYFTPIVFIRHQDPLKGSFKQIHSIDISGEINSQKIFEFKNKKSLKAGYSLTWIREGYKFRERDVTFNNQMVNAIYNKEVLRYNKWQTGFLDYITAIEEIKSPAKRKKAFYELIADAEEAYYDNQWTRKRISWFKLNVTPLSWDNFSYTDATNIASYSVPSEKSVYTPSVKFSYNRLSNIIRNSMKIYASAWLGFSQKHTLSEMATPVQWYNFRRLSDSTFTVTDDKKVYTLKASDFQTGVRPDVGGQLIVLVELPGKNSVGLDVYTSWKGIVTDRNGSFVNKSGIGLLFPLVGKDGEVSVNIEPFIERKSYIKATGASTSYGGIKFGLPINRL